MTETNATATEAKQKFWRDLLEKANADADFRRRLETDPAAVLSEMGIRLPPGTRFVCEPATPDTADAVVARSTATEIHIPIIEHADEALADAQLEQVSGGIKLIRDVVITDRPPPVLDSVSGSIWEDR